MTAPDRLWNRWVATGDTRALGQLFDQTGPGLRRMAQYLAHDPAAADDALQGTFLAALERPRDLGSDGRVEAWLAGILIRQVRRQRRARARDQSVGAGTDAAESALASAASTDPSPAGVLASDELESRVSMLIAGLPATYAEPLRLRLLVGDSAQSIAHDLGLSLGTVHKRLSRGLKKLRQVLPAALAAPALGQTGATGIGSVRAHVLEAAAGQHAATTLGASASWSLRSALLLVGLTGLSTLAAWWAISAAPGPEEARVQAIRHEDASTAKHAMDSSVELTVVKAAASPQGSSRQVAKVAVGRELRLHDDHTEPVTLYPHSATAVVEVLDDLGQSIEGIEVSVMQEFRTLATDAQGRAVFDRLQEGEFSIRVDRPGVKFRRARGLGVLEQARQQVQLVTGQKTLVRFVFPRTGSVRLGLKRPPEGDVGSLTYLAGHIRTIEFGREDRSFVIPFDDTVLIEGLTPGEYLVSMTEPMGSELIFLDPHEVITVVPGMEIEHTIRTQVGSASIQGVVLDSLGRPVPLFSLSARQRFSDGAPVAGRKMIRTNSEGRFEIKGLEPGPHNLRPLVSFARGRHFAWPVDQGCIRVEAPASELQVVLADAGSVEVYLTGIAHGFSVQIDRAGPVMDEQAFSLADGFAEIRNLPEGDYELSLLQSGTQPTKKKTERIHVTAGEQVEVHWEAQ